MKSLYIIIIGLWLCGCTNESQMEQLRQDVIDTDIAFSELSLANGMNHAFSTYCAENGVLLREGSLPVVGKNTIDAILNENNDSIFNLTWRPSDAVVARSGDLGYTYGIYTMQLKETGESQQGTYVSIWIREEGQWKFSLDTGNEGLGE